jgi:hypothetical protein
MTSSMLNAILGVERIRRTPVRRSMLVDLRDALERRAARMFRHNRRARAFQDLGIKDRFNGMEG